MKNFKLAVSAPPLILGWHTQAGLVSFRYKWVVGPKTAQCGQLLIASFTFTHLRPPK